MVPPTAKTLRWRIVPTVMELSSLSVPSAAGIRVAMESLHQEGQSLFLPVVKKLEETENPPGSVCWGDHALLRSYLSI